jgi:hypothetical protein
MASITARYHSAVHAKSLRPDAVKGYEGRSYTDTDVLGAMGLADRHLTEGRNGQGDPVKLAPLAVPLERLFAGDSRAATEIVAKLAEMAWYQGRNMDIRISRPLAYDIACACLAWHRNGTCRACGGHGFDLIPGVPSLSAHQCQTCRGSGKILFDAQFHADLAPLARWLVTEMEREAGRAGQAAMRTLADRMEL